MNRPFSRQAAVAVAAIFVIPILAAWAQPARADSPFPDKNLEAAIRDVLKHEPKVALTDEKLLDIYFLEAPGKEIKDLKGLEKCKNLALIKLTKNKISDLSPLKDLANLQSLDLADNEIKDISPLAGLKSLQYIVLTGNKIEKIDALKDLTAVNSLYLGKNEIKDISPLAGLNKMWTLSAPKNQIKDISVLSKLTKLQTIDLQDNKIEDATPLGKQTELKLLLIERNQIKDLKALVDAAKADSAGPKRFAPYLHVYLDGNPLPEATKSAQVAALKAADVKVDEKKAGDRSAHSTDARRARADSSDTIDGVASGSRRTNRLPRPGSLSTRIVPRKTAAIRSTTASPSPTPGRRRDFTER